MVTKAITATNVGINAYKIEVEVDVAHSLPSISIVCQIVLLMRLKNVSIPQ